MSISDAMYKELETEFGKEYADLVSNAAVQYGKELENRGEAFKSTPTKTLSEGELLILAGLKQLTDTSAVQEKAIDADRKTTKDLSNRVETIEKTLGEIKDVTKRMTEWFGQLVGKQTAASKSANTQVPANDPQMQFLGKKNEEGASRGVPIFNQMKSLGYGGQVEMPNFPFGDEPTAPAPAANGTTEQSGSPTP